MKSSIRIDFRGVHNSLNLEPIIRVNIEDSDDPRDGLLSAFFESLGDKSNWLSVEFNQHGANKKECIIHAVHSDELEETRDIIENRLGLSMQARFEELQKELEKHN